MNPNQPMDSGAEMNDAVMQKLKSYRWKGRALTSIALGIGLLSVVAGIVLMWANSVFLFPEVQSLVKNSGSAQATNTNSIAQTNADAGRFTLSDGTTVDQQVIVTLILGKAMWVTSRSVFLVGLGTLVTLLLVIFNRQVTLRQINASLAQISNQIRELQDGKKS